MYAAWSICILTLCSTIINLAGAVFLSVTFIENVILFLLITESIDTSNDAGGPGYIHVDNTEWIHA